MKDRFYDVGLFEEWLKNTPSKIKQFIKKESKLLETKISKNSVVLDVGCGHGRMMKILSKKAKKIVGIDNNKRMINKAKQYLKGTTGYELFFGNAEKMPFDDSSFDYVICTLNTFGDFGNAKSTILNEMRRVTKKNGKIMITVWSEKVLKERIQAYKNVGAEIEKIEGQNITLKNSHRSKAFTKQELNQFFKTKNFKSKIIPLYNVGYFCELTKLRGQ